MKAIFLAVLFLQVNLSFGQNLIPNGTLEDANICTERQQPCSPSGWWYIVKDAPAGYFSPNYGKGYSNLVLVTAASGHVSRRYWQTMLLCPLRPGEKYIARIKVSANGEGPNLHDIGFYFTDNMVFAHEDTLLQPGAYFDFLGAKVTELRNYWFLLEKEITITEARRCLIVGNFSKESNRRIIRERRSRDNVMLMTIDDLELVPENKADCPEAQRVKDSLYAIHGRHGGKDMDTIYVDIKDMDTMVVKKIDTLRINNIQFEVDSYVLKNELVLDSLRGVFVGRDIKSVQVVGYTDNTGSDQYNKDLSEKRAREIGRLIVLKFGVPASMVVTEGRGISNDFADKRLNRRVEVYVYH